VTSLSGTKSSLRINLSAARLFKNFALGIHGAPQADQATIDLETDLLEMPDGVGL
jgi:hypothetical protein